MVLPTFTQNIFHTSHQSIQLTLNLYREKDREKCYDKGPILNYPLAQPAWRNSSHYNCKGKQKKNKQEEKQWQMTDSKITHSTAYPEKQFSWQLKFKKWADCTTYLPCPNNGPRNRWEVMAFAHATRLTQGVLHLK